VRARNQFLFYVVFVLGAAIYYRHTLQIVFQANKNSAPQTISAFPRTQFISGQKAIESIQQLHGKNFNIEDGAVAVYGNQNVILWVSDAGSDQTATNLTSQMETRIADGTSPVAPLGSFDLHGFCHLRIEWFGKEALLLAIWTTGFVAGCGRPPGRGGAPRGGGVLSVGYQR